MATSMKWKTLCLPTPKKTKTGKPVEDHPLINIVISENTTSADRILVSEIKRSNFPSKTITNTKKNIGLDPLSEFALEMDPLSRAALEVEEYTVNSKLDCDEQLNHIKMEPWSSRKMGILSKFTTSEKLCIISFLPDGEKVLVKAQSGSVDKVQHRLDQLDSLEENTQKRSNLSQAEYVGQIEQLNKELVLAWNTEQRVKALKIAIQCAKLLADTDVLQFYPSKFVLVTNILDTFGKIVYDRLKSKADLAKTFSTNKTPLPSDFSPDMVPESARETCLNWFYKIASIRELVPRVYVELALIKSYNFISTNDCPEGLLRISDMIMGIGNSLVATYARCYLCIVGLNALNKKSDYTFLQSCFKGLIGAYQHIFNKGVISELNTKKINMTSYLTLYTPALNYIIEAVACYTDEIFLADLLVICRRHKNSSILLNTLLSVFKPKQISEKILEILDLIEHCADHNAVPLSVLLKALGNAVNTCSPSSEHTGLLLTTISRHLNSLADTKDFMNCLDAWIIYFVKHLTGEDLSKLLGDIIEHLVPNRKYEECYNNLKLIINKIVSNTPDFEILLTLENFLLIIDLFHEESIKVEVCKNILVLSHNDQKTNDPVVINTLMYLCSIVHDSVNALIPEDEYRQIGEIICSILRRVDFGRDCEQQLNFYVMARAAFCNIDLVLAELVQQVNTLSVNARQVVKGNHTKKTGDFVRACAAFCFITIPSVISEKSRLQLYLLSGQVALFNQCFGQVNTLSVNARQVVKGNHTKKTGDFVRACAAFCFITIPSVISEKSRLQLYLLSGQVALFNQCFGQAEDCFKAAWSIVVNLKDQFNQKDPFLISYLKETVSALLVLPDNPERGVLSVLRLLLNTLKSLEMVEDYILASIYISVINMLSAMAQDEFLYQVDKVESNDALYGADPKFVAEIDKICTVLLSEIKMSLTKHPGSINQYKLATELLTTILTRADLSDKELQILATSLWGIITKNSHADRHFISGTRLYIENSHKLKNTEMFNDFIQQLRIP